MSTVLGATKDGSHLINIADFTFEKEQEIAFLQL